MPVKDSNTVWNMISKHHRKDLPAKCYYNKEVAKVRSAWRLRGYAEKKAWKEESNI